MPGLVPDLSMSEPQRRESGGGVDLVAETIAGLLGRRAVVAKAICLNDQADFGPVEVGAEAVHVLTSPVRTLMDLALRLDPDSLRLALESYAGQPGVGKMGAVLDTRALTLTDSELERRFIPIAVRAGLPQPARSNSGALVTEHRVRSTRE